MIEKVRELFSVYPNLNVGVVGSQIVVYTIHPTICSFLMNEGGVYDVWLSMSNKHSCLSQHMVKVMYDVLVVLNEESLT